MQERNLNPQSYFKMKNQRLLFQQKARWDWVADRVGTPDISAWKPDKHKGGPERNKAGTRNPQNLLMIWVNIWLNTTSLANLDMFQSPGERVRFSHIREESTDGTGEGKPALIAPHTGSV